MLTYTSSYWTIWNVAIWLQASLCPVGLVYLAYTKSQRPWVASSMPSNSGPWHAHKIFRGPGVHLEVFMPCCLPKRPTHPEPTQRHPRTWWAPVGSMDNSSNGDCYYYPRNYLLCLTWCKLVLDIWKGIPPICLRQFTVTASCHIPHLLARVVHWLETTVALTTYGKSLFLKEI